MAGGTPCPPRGPAARRGRPDRVRARLASDPAVPLRPPRGPTHGPLAEAVPTSLWLLLAPEHRRLAAPMRAALWRAATRRTLAEAA